jgi:hypothetical protein
VGFRDWLKPPLERRQSPRKTVPDLRAVYWDGATNLARPIADIGAGGAAIETDLDWYVGTLIRLTICQSHPAESAAKHENLWCEVVRKTPKGFGIRFLFQNQSELRGFRRYFDSFNSEVKK